MKISIVVPIYNVEQYLERCVDSLINQTYTDIEIILVNDGSTDSSLEICKRYQQLDDRIIVIDKTNGGLSDARNFGLEKATGDYVLFVDSDDFVSEETCEKFVAKTMGNPDIISGDAKVIYEDRTNFMRRLMSEEEECDGETFLERELANGTMYMAAWLNLYKRSFLQENKLSFEKGLLHEDEEFTPRAFLKAKKVKCINFDFYHYVIRENSLSTKKDLSKNAKHLYSTLYKHEKMYDAVQNDNLKVLLKNSLVDKYLNMFQLLKNTKSGTDIEFDVDFLKRNAFSKKNKVKVGLFSINKTLYYTTNKVQKECTEDVHTLLKGDHGVMSIILLLGVVLLSRFFTLYLGADDSIWNTMFVWLSRLYVVLIGGAYVLFKWKRIKTEKEWYSIGVIAFYVLIFVLNVVAGGNMRRVISTVYPPAGLIMLLEMVYRINAKKATVALNYIFNLLITLNFLQILLFGDAIGEYRYLLGYRNQMGLVLFITIFLGYLYYLMRDTKMFFVYSFVLTVLTVIMLGSMNNLIALAVILLYMVMPKNVKAKIDKPFSNHLVLIYIVSFVSVVILRVQNIFSFLIEDILHRSLSLSGRTYIWDEAIRLIKLNPILGYGRGETANYFAVEYYMSNLSLKQGVYSAHNAFLQTCYEFGIIPIILMLGLLYYYTRQIKRMSTKEMGMFYAILFAMLIILTMEAVGFDGVFVLVAIGYFFALQNKVSDKERVA